jgi:hypothetical protein
MNAIEATIAGLQGKTVEGVRGNSLTNLLMRFNYKINSWEFQEELTLQWYQTLRIPYEFISVKEWQLYTPPLKLEVGKCYKTRNNELVRIVAIYPSWCDTTHPVRVARMVDGTWQCVYGLGLTGKWINTGTDNDDLIEECPLPEGAVE